MMYLFISCSTTRSTSTMSTDKREMLYMQNVKKYEAANKRILYESYLQYITLASLTDTSGVVTDQSVWDFKNLFESGARVLNDIQLYPQGDQQLIEADYYADIVSSFMNRKGVVTEFDTPDINTFFAGTGAQFDPKVDDAEEDDYNFYYTYETIKRNYNILNKNNQVLYYDEAIEYPIVITFRISIKNQSADIVSILPQK